MSYEDLLGRWPWRPIPGCPGRYVLSPDAFSGRPDQLSAKLCRAVETRSDLAVNPVHIVRLNAGGLISYRQPDGRFVHTLNTTEGFERKLAQLEIDFPDLADVQEVKKQ
jgi:hypothetical protein